MKAWGRLLRLSLAPTAAADIAAGVVFGSHGEWIAGASPWLLICASLAIYHGNLAVNDWRDRDHDARTRPGRPIPARRVTPGAALSLGLGLVGLGVGLAFGAAFECGLWMSAVAVVALAYNMFGRGGFTGPVLLGACRAGNLGAGLMLAGWMGTRTGELNEVAWLCGLYFTYVFTLSRMGRMEDAEDAAPLGRRPSLHLGVCAVVLLCVPLAPRWPPAEIARLLAFVLTAAAAAGLARAAWSTPAWDRATVERAMGLTLRRLLIFTGAVAILALQPAIAAPAVVAIGILCGYPLSRGLRGVFPPS
jgi:4-hydroxybenzoate polyprenyltransferase